MKPRKPLIASLIVSLVAASTAGAADDKPPKLVQKNEARLAKLLEGRTPGEPVTCIPALQSNDVQIFEGVAMVYGRGETIYVSRPASPQMLRRDDIVVVNRFGGQLCNTDIIRTIDRMSGFMTGALFLEKFVPYKKPE